MWRWLLMVILAAVSTAHAHKPSDSYLSLNVAGAAISGQWDIALRDLDFAIGLDADGDGAITWGEVKARHAVIAAYASGRLALRADGAACTITVGEQLIDDHTDGAYSVLPLQVHCPSRPAALSVDYRLFAELDPQHRGLLKLTVDGQTRTAVLGPQANPQTFELTSPSRIAQFAAYARDGVWHIWIGYDHILFLLSLLLPAVLLIAPRPAASRQAPATVARPLRRQLLAPSGGGRGTPRPGADTKGGQGNLGAARRFFERRARRWVAVGSFGAAFWDVFRIVTAFTVAHSITLTLATLGWVSLPSRVVESAIAASVVLAALNNVWPLTHDRRWLVAFAFGLLHGFGFAMVLTDLGLPREALALALVGFNLGVEAGQLAIVALFLPLAYALRRTATYRRWVLTGGSLLIALLASVWFVERAFGVAVLA